MRYFPFLFTVVDDIMIYTMCRGVRRKLDCSLFADLCRKSRAWSSTTSFSDIDDKVDIGDDGDYTDSRRELEPQSVDPKKGWRFRGVHKVFKSYVIQRFMVWFLGLQEHNLTLVDIFCSC